MAKPHLYSNTQKNKKSERTKNGGKYGIINFFLVLALALAIIAFLFIRGFKGVAFILIILLVLGAAAIFLFPRFGAGVVGGGSFLGALGL